MLSTFFGNISIGFTFIDIKDLKDLMTPLLIANATILALISARNGDLASRQRALKEEILYKEPDKITTSRIKSVNKQIKWLFLRHCLSTAGLCFATIGIGCLVYFILNIENKESLQNILSTAIKFDIAGLLSLLLEFALGSFTLYTNWKGDMISSK